MKFSGLNRALSTKMNKEAKFYQTFHIFGDRSFNRPLTVINNSGYP